MNLIQILLPIISAFVISAVVTKLEIPLLKRLKAGQSIREEGPQAHLAKAGTPTMGGIAMLIAVTAACLIWCPTADAAVCVLVMLAYGGIGFFDDYIKVVKKRNLGLTAVQKLVLQILVAVLIALYRSRVDTLVFLPFAKITINFGILYVPFVAFVMVAMTNAVNLTDGLDGLASSVTAIASFVFAVLCAISAYKASMTFAACMCGACLGFLVYNHHPAKLFMGDTGSLALGGGLASLAILSDYEFLLPIAGGIYVAEAASVIIQVFVFQTQNGRRFFRMAPIHHHFELGGWKETKVVGVFSLVTAILGVIAFISAI